MTNCRISFEGSKLNLGEHSRDLGHVIKQAERINDRILVVFKFGAAYGERMDKENAAILDEHGNLIRWVEDAPIPSEFRSYTGFMHGEDGKLKIETVFGVRYTLNIQTGAVTEGELVRFG